MPEETRPKVYQVFMLGLCLYVLGVLAVETFVPLGADTKAILDAVDVGICVVFLLDFAGNLLFAADRLAYLKWGWVDLISSIPMVGELRIGRIARVIRILRVVRGIRSTRLLLAFFRQRRAQSTFAAACFVALMTLVFSSIAILQAEGTADGTIKTPEDALWWSIVTITTVGYGDKFPVTTEGRLIAAVVMCVGVGLFGAFTGFLATWFLAPEEEDQDAELAEMRRELVEIRELLSKLVKGQ